MIQPPWDKIIKQLRVNHLSVIGINDPEHRYNELEGKKRSFISKAPTVHSIQFVGYLLFKEPNKTIIYNERQISKPANNCKDCSNFNPLVVTVGVLPLSLISQLCSLRRRALFVREREMVSLSSGTAPFQG